MDRHYFSFCRLRAEGWPFCTNHVKALNQSIPWIMNWTTPWILHAPTIVCSIKTSWLDSTLFLTGLFLHSLPAAVLFTPSCPKAKVRSFLALFGCLENGAIGTRNCVFWVLLCFLCLCWLRKLLDFFYFCCWGNRGGEGERERYYDCCFLFSEKGKGMVHWKPNHVKRWERILFFFFKNLNFPTFSRQPNRGLGHFHLLGVSCSTSHLMVSWIYQRLRSSRN